MQGVIRAGDEGCFIRTQEEGERGHFIRLSHSPDGLRFGQFLEHFLFSSGISISQVAINKWRVDPGRGDAITPNVVTQIVFCNGVRPSYHSAFAHRISEAVGKTRGSRNGSHIQDHAAAAGFHVPNGSEHAIIESLHVHSENALEVRIRRVFQRTDVRNTCVVHKNVNGPCAGEFIESRSHFFLVRYVAWKCRRISALGSNLLASCCRILFIKVQNANRGTIRRESQGEGSSNAATATGYNGDFAVQSETLRMGVLICQRERPLFQGMKSSCPFSSTLFPTTSAPSLSSLLHLGCVLAEVTLHQIDGARI